MQAISALALFRLGAIGEQTFVYKNLKAYSSHVMQLPDMGLCMHVDILMNFMRAKFQVATLSNKRAVAVRTFHDFDSKWRKSLDLR